MTAKRSVAADGCPYSVHEREGEDVTRQCKDKEQDQALDKLHADRRMGETSFRMAAAKGCCRSRRSRTGASRLRCRAVAGASWAVAGAPKREPEEPFTAPADRTAERSSSFSRREPKQCRRRRPASRRCLGRVTTDLGDEAGRLRHQRPQPQDAGGRQGPEPSSRRQVVP